MPAKTLVAALARRPLSPVSIDVSSGSRVRGDDRRVGRDAIARLEQQDIADHDVAGVDHRGQAVAPDHDLVREQVAQPLGGARRLGLLHEREQRVEHDHDRDRDASCGKTGHEGERHAPHSMSAKKWTSWWTKRR